MEDEEGAERVEEILREGEVLIPFPVLLEVYYITLRERSEQVADERYALVRNLPATEIWHVDEHVLLTAARLKAQHRLSFANALIAAFALQYRAVLVHEDPEYEPLTGVVQQEPLLYRTS
jgi:predicted nucleic acid-binding protein